VRVQICKRLERVHPNFGLGWCVKFKNKLWYRLVSQFEQEASMFQPLVMFCYTLSHFSYISVIIFWYQTVEISLYRRHKWEAVLFISECFMSKIVWWFPVKLCEYHMQPGIRLTI
jgi:hypothetical protein